MSGLPSAFSKLMRGCDRAEAIHKKGARVLDLTSKLNSQNWPSRLSKDQILIHIAKFIHLNTLQKKIVTQNRKNYLDKANKGYFLSVAGNKVRRHKDQQTQYAV